MGSQIEECAFPVPASAQQVDCLLHASVRCQQVLQNLPGQRDGILFAFDPSTTCPEIDKFIGEVFPVRERPTAAQTFYQKLAEEGPGGHLRASIEALDQHQAERFLPSTKITCFLICAFSQRVRFRTKSESPKIRASRTSTLSGKHGRRANQASDYPHRQAQALSRKPRLICWLFGSPLPGMVYAKTSTKSYCCSLT